MKKKGFTLVEIVVAVTISTIIMGGVFIFLTKLQKDIVLAKESTRVHLWLTDFMGAMQNFRKQYGTGMVAVGGSGVYNAGLLTNKEKTSWVLIGVVSDESTNNNSKLDPIANKGIYGKKILAYQKLTANQVNSILSDTGTVYDVKFSDEWLFKNIPMKDFSIKSYNSGSLFEYRIDVETPFYEELNGKNIQDIEPDVVSFSFTLDF